MGKEHIVQHQIKKGEVRNPKGINQYTYMNGAKAIASKLVGMEFEDIDEKELTEAFKMVMRFIVSSNKKQLKKISENENLTLFVQAMIKQYMSKRGYEQMMRDFGLDKGAGLSVDMGEDTSITFRWVM